MANEVGMPFTDSHNNPLDDMKLTGTSPDNQTCLVTASTRELHSEIRECIEKTIDLLRSRAHVLDEMIGFEPV